MKASMFSEAVNYRWPAVHHLRSRTAARLIISHAQRPSKRQDLLVDDGGYEREAALIERGRS